MSPRLPPIDASADSPEVDPRTGLPYIAVGDDGIISESVSSMEDESTVPNDVVRAVPNVKAAASLKSPSLNLSKQQRRNLNKKNNALAKKASS